MKKRWILAALSGACFSSCAPPERVRDSVLPMASFDLNCPKSRIRLVEVRRDNLSEGSYGAIGCGKRIRYYTSCGYFQCVTRTLPEQAIRETASQSVHEEEW